MGKKIYVYIYKIFKYLHGGNKMWISYKIKNTRKWINLDKVEDIMISNDEILFNFRRNVVSSVGDDYIRIPHETEEYRLIRNFLERKFECYPIN